MEMRIQQIAAARERRLKYRMAASSRTIETARATVVTLARLAGVAPSTVSRALADDPRISQATRVRIKTLAQQCGYTVNAAARSLSNGRSGLIGLVLGPLDNPFYGELMQAAVLQAEARGLRLLLLHAGHGAIEEHTASALLQYQVDGCLITSAGLPSQAASICAAHQVPVVMVNRVPRLHASAVACDNDAGAREMAAFLHACGHRRYAVIRGNADTSTSLERERGFAEALADRGAAPALFFDGASSYEGGGAAGRAIASMAAAERPDAVFAVADIMAMGALDSLRIAGIRVPDEISVAGFDGIAEGARPIYDLTTIEQPIGVMVRRSLDLLESRIGTATLPDEVIHLRGRFLQRGSTKARVLLRNCIDMPGAPT